MAPARRSPDHGEPPQLFAGQKFWLAQKIPNRKDHVGRIKALGGTTVPTEAKADYVIADGSRDSFPSGALSYEFIEDCYNYGRLQLPERYLLGFDPETKEYKAGSNRPTKQTRSLFTQEDESLLAKFMIDNTPSDLTIQELFVHLHQLSPNHTAQSWRTRWKKMKEDYTSEALYALARANPPRNYKIGTAHSDAASRGQSTVRMGSPEALAASQSPPAPPEAPPQSSEMEVKDEGRQDLSVITINSTTDSDTGMDEEQRESRAAFFRDLVTFGQSKGRAICAYHTVGKKKIDLLQLFEAVIDQEAPFFKDCKWKDVAEHQELGLDGDDPTVVKELEKIWNENLREFQAQLPSDDGEEDEMEDAPTGDDQAPEPSQQKDDEPSHIPDACEEAFNSSPPKLPPSTSSKRSRVVSQAQIGRKRRRLSPDTEIPSTPDEKLGVKRPAVTLDEDIINIEDNEEHTRTTENGNLDEVEEADYNHDEMRLSFEPDQLRPSIEKSYIEEDKAPQAGAKTQVKRRLFNVEVKDSQEDSQAAYTQAKTQTKAQKGSPLKTQQTQVDVTPSQQLRADDPYAFEPSPEPNASRLRNTVSRLRKSPTAQIVPGTQVSSTQSRIAKSSDTEAKSAPETSPQTKKTIPKSPEQGKKETPKPLPKSTRPVDSQSPRYVPPAVIPPRRTLPGSFGFTKQPKVAPLVPPPQPPPEQASSSRSPQTAATPRRSETAATSRRSASHQATPDLKAFPRKHPAPSHPACLPAAHIRRDWTLPDWRDYYEQYYDPRTVHAALMATTLTVGGQEEDVMKYLEIHKKIPSNYEGVWDERDDKGLRHVAAIERKHGEPLYVADNSKFNVKGKGTLDETGKARKEKARLINKHGKLGLEERLRYLKDKAKLESRP